MLVVTRKQGESIVINDNIEVCILECSDGSVKIGIDAPKNIKILRKEIITDIKEQNKASVNNLESIIKKIK